MLCVLRLALRHKKKQQQNIQPAGPATVLQPAGRNNVPITPLLTRSYRYIFNVVVKSDGSQRF